MEILYFNTKIFELNLPENENFKFGFVNIFIKHKN
jgi:hypothetical protein